MHKNGYNNVLLFVLTATLGGIFLCGENDLITIFIALEIFKSVLIYLAQNMNRVIINSKIFKHNVQNIPKNCDASTLSRILYKLGFNWAIKLCSNS